MINKEHQEAQELSARAALSLRESKTGEARRLFAEAAKLEKAALAKVPAEKSRTRGILAVSVAALLYKAGVDGAEGEIVSLLADPSLTPAARRQITDLLGQVRAAGAGKPCPPRASALG